MAGTCSWSMRSITRGPIRVGSGDGPQARPRRTFLLVGVTGGLLALMPLLLSPYALIQLGNALVLSITCLGLNLVFGTTGLLSLGHAAYFGVGAYAGGFLYYFGSLTSLEVYLVSGVVASTALAAVLGLLCVRATRIHFTILTLAFTQMVHALFISGAVFQPFGTVGKGLYFLYEGGLYIPRFTILGTEVPLERFIPVFYYVIAGAFLVSALLAWQITHSPFGKALKAIRDNDLRAACIGIPVRAYRWYAFTLSGVFTGLAGGLYGELNRQITPEQLHWLFSAQLILTTVLGGSRHFLGPVVGAFAFVALEDVALRFTQYHGLVLGVILVALVLAFPGGLAGSAAALIRRTRELWPPHSSSARCL